MAASGLILGAAGAWTFSASQAAGGQGPIYASSDIQRETAGIMIMNTPPAA
jgi:hypothetical protein